LKAVGEWLLENGAPGKRVMSLSTAIPFYADALWITTPISSPARTLAYAEEQKADFVVMRTDDGFEGYLARMPGGGEGFPSWRVVHRETRNRYNSLVVLAPVR
jgi:hypothetical protein